MTTNSISKYRQAPELQTVHWFNAEHAVTLESLRDRVVLIEAFQMLCPGCVSHGLPQAMPVANTFSAEEANPLNNAGDEQGAENQQCDDSGCSIPIVPRDEGLK